MNRINWDAIILTAKDAGLYLVCLVVATTVLVGGYALFNYIHLYAGFALVCVIGIFLAGHAGYRAYKKNARKLL